MSQNRAHDIAESLAARKETVLSHLFPAGQVIGKEFCVGSLAGEAGKSLKVHLNGSDKGTVWKDFATGEGGGDLLDLWAASRCGRDIKRAMTEAQEWLGQPPSPQPPKGHKTGEWIYRDCDGSPWICISRHDYPGGGKAFFQYDLKAKQPIRSGGHQLPERRPLYNLDRLQTPDQEVWFVEGEKAADALGSLGFLTTTTIGGSSSPHKTDFTPLIGRQVWVWRDNDRAGLKYAEQVTKLVQEAGGTPKTLSLPQGKPEKWDAADAIAEGWGREEVTALLSQAQPSPPDEPPWPTPEPLPEALPAVPALEPQMIPLPFRGWLTDIADRMQCPLDFPTVAAMVAVGALVGRQLGVRPKRQDDWLVVPNLWGMIIGRPGLMKTPAIKEAIRPLDRLIVEARETYATELDAFAKNQRQRAIERKVLEKELEKCIREKIAPREPKGKNAKESV